MQDNSETKLKQYLYRVQPVRPEMLLEPTSEEQSIVSEHAAYLKGLISEGVVLLCGRTLNTDNSSFGIVIFRAENEEVARSIMHNDPAVKKRVMQAELYPYQIAMSGNFDHL